MIVIVPFGAISKDLLNFLREELAYRFREEVQAADPEPIPEGAFDPKRNQYRSSLFLRTLEEERTDEDRQEIERRIGLVDADLYNPESEEALSEADPVDRVAVVSLAYLHPESPALSEEDPRFRTRVLKAAAHELGHTYRFDHCNHPKCVMRRSESAADLDQKGADFCLEHQAKLKRP